MINRLTTYRKQLEEEVNPQIEDKTQKQIFESYEGLRDKAKTGPTWLAEESIANVVQNSLHFYDDAAYDLYAYCVMPNHIHIVFRHRIEEKDGSKNDNPIIKILHSIKSYSGLECNKILGRTGAFWQSESYDRVIRDSDELGNTIRYALKNPVKAGLVKTWEKWPYSYWNIVALNMPGFTFLSNAKITIIQFYYDYIL